MQTWMVYADFLEENGEDTQELRESLSFNNKWFPQYYNNTVGGNIGGNKEIVYIAAGNVVGGLKPFGRNVGVVGNVACASIKMNYVGSSFFG